MTIRARRLAIVLAACALVAGACRRPGHDQEHGHDHADPAGGATLPSRSVTVWTAVSELFMEHPALVQGRQAAFAAHVTTLAGWKPLARGKLTVTLRMADGRTTVAEAAAPSRPGLFRPTLAPAAAGACTLTVSIEDPAHVDRIDAGPCQVYADERAAMAEAEEDDRGGAISFLKEQQWVTEFATAAVTARALQPTVRLHGEIVVVAGKEARLAAAASGRVQLAVPAPVIGSTVRKGQLLATVLPRLAGGTDRATLEADLAAARAQAIAAEAQLGRAERLHADESIPRRSVEEARASAAVARARLGAAEGRMAQQSATAGGLAGAGSVRGAFQIRSPLAGTLAAARVASGESVDEGQVLFVVVDLARVWLEARVFEPDIPKVEAAESGWFWLEGHDEPFAFGPGNARRVTLGRVLDGQTRTVPLIFELDNTAGRFRIGQFAKIDVAAGEPVTGLAIPLAAVVEEGGRPVAYVQRGGESFERRLLALGARGGGWVAVRDGLRAGERVVVKGAYEVKLAASAGGAPAHGHAH